MKKIISYSFLALCLIFSGCEKKFGEGVSLKGIEVEEVFNIGLYQSGKAKAYPIPWDCTNYEFSWSSSDPSIASVNEWGVVTAESDRAAECTLTVSGGGFSKTIKVNVIQKEQMELFEESGVQHLYLFEEASNLLKATIGADLRSMTGNEPFIQVAGYNDKKKAMRIPASRLDERGQYKFNGLFLNHGFDANPSGQSRVNQFTVLVDIKFAPRCCNYSFNADNELVTTSLPNGPGPFQYEAGWSPGWTYGLFTTAFDPTSLDITGNNMGFRWHDNGQYGIRDVTTTGDSKFRRDTWYRFVICCDFGVGVTYYKNGLKEVHNNNSNQMSINNGDRTWPTTGILLFAHNGGGNVTPRPDQFEAHEVEIATLAIWNRCLSESEARGLTLPDPDAFGKLLVE